MTRWRLPPSLTGAALLHAAGGAMLAANPATWPYVLGTLAASHVAITGVCMMPQSRLFGPNVSRLPGVAADRREIALTFDDGPDPAMTPVVLDLLDQARARATFFCVGQHVRAHPDLAREIIRRGHAVENHTEHHRYSFGFNGPRRHHYEVSRAQEAIITATGVAPRFVRAPVGVRNPFLDDVLRELALTYVSWTRRGFDTFDGAAARVAARLIDTLRAGDILLLHDGDTTFHANLRAPLTEVLPRVLDAIAANGLRPVRLGDALP